MLFLRRCQCQFLISSRSMQSLNVILNAPLVWCRNCASSQMEVERNRISEKQQLIIQFLIIRVRVVDGEKPTQSSELQWV